MNEIPEIIDGTLVLQGNLTKKGLCVEKLVVISVADPRITHIVNRWFLKKQYSLYGFNVWSYGRNSVLKGSFEYEASQEFALMLANVADRFNLDSESASIKIEGGLATLVWNGLAYTISPEEAGTIAWSVKEQFEKIW